MNCSKCGQPLDPGAVFCGNCGQPVVAGSPAANPASPATAQVPVTPAETVSPPNAVAPQPTTAAVQPAVAVPAYAVASEQKPGETKAIIGLISAVLAIPGAIIPIAGFVFGITAIVLGSMSIHRKHNLARLAFIFGTIGIVLSIGVFIYNVQNIAKGDISLGSDPQTISTPCYSMQINKAFHVDNSGGDCIVEAYNASTKATSSLAYVVESSDSSSITSANFEKNAKSAAPIFAQGLSEDGRTYSVTSQKSGTFASKQAYYVDLKDNKGGTTEFAIVLANAPNGDNLFVFGVVDINGSANLKALESTIEWK